MLGYLVRDALKACYEIEVQKCVAQIIAKTATIDMGRWINKQKSKWV